MKAAALTQDVDTWQTLAAATAGVLVKLTEEQKERTDKERGPGRDDERDRTADAEYIQQRIRDMERFENLVRGTIAPRRKRN